MSTYQKTGRTFYVFAVVAIQTTKFHLCKIAKCKKKFGCGLGMEKDEISVDLGHQIWRVMISSKFIATI